eukprot:COSAG02_NODE_8756_length_2454_cov_5.012534_1_plen_53_part_10
MHTATHISYNNEKDKKRKKKKKKRGEESRQQQQLFAHIAPHKGGRSVPYQQRR